MDPQAIALLPEAAALSRPALSRFVNRARAVVGLEGEVEVLFTTDAELKRLNRAFRKKNKATDILSFPAPAEIAAHHAGDLAISLETAARQAAQFSHTLSDELRVLILHGLLHLAGLDHEADRGEMAARESELRTTLKLPVSLIARATTKSVAKPSSSKARENSLPTSKARHPERSAPQTNQLRHPERSAPQTNQLRHPERSAKRVVEGPPHLSFAHSSKASLSKPIKKKAAK